MTADPYYYRLLKEFARKNKKYQTFEENYLWEYIRAGNIGYKFKRQHIIGQYIADFICLEKKLIIEVDGGYHSQYEQRIKDCRRTKILEGYDYRILRFKNEEIIENIEAVIQSIINTIETYEQ
ncbi:MAG: DUF559 domain-containing protein [Prevotella sp.]|nr:DUF559 domain-containing protein [Prevotella sp.]